MANENGKGAGDSRVGVLSSPPFFVFSARPAGKIPADAEQNIYIKLTLHDLQ